MYAVRCVSGFPRFRAYGHDWPADRWVVVDDLPVEALSEKALSVVEVSSPDDIDKLPPFPVETRTRVLPVKKGGKHA